MHSNEHNWQTNWFVSEPSEWSPPWQHCDIPFKDWDSLGVNFLVQASWRNCLKYVLFWFLNKCLFLLRKKNQWIKRYLLPWIYSVFKLSLCHKGVALCILCILTEYFYMCYAHENIKDDFQKIKHFFLQEECQEYAFLLKKYF